MIRRLVTLAALAVATVLTTALPASAAIQEPQFRTVAWQMPTWEVVNNQPVPTWPQTLFVASDPSTVKDYATLDLPECGYFQIDLYRYTTEQDRANVDALIAGGTLTAPNKPYPEPVVKAKLVNRYNCDSPSPSPSESTPSPSPSESSPSPTPSTSTPPPPSPTPPSSPPVSTPPCDYPDCLPHTGGSLTGLAVAGGLLAAGIPLVWLSTRRKGQHQ